MIDRMQVLQLAVHASGNSVKDVMILAEEFENFLINNSRKDAVDILTKSISTLRDGESAALGRHDNLRAAAFEHSIAILNRVLDDLKAD